MSSFLLGVKYFACRAQFSAHLLCVFDQLMILGSLIWRMDIIMIVFTEYYLLALMLSITLLLKAKLTLTILKFCFTS